MRNTTPKNVTTNLVVKYTQLDNDDVIYAHTKTEELYKKNFRLMKDNEKLRKKYEILNKENQALASQLKQKFSNGASNSKTNAPNNMLDLNHSLSLGSGSSQNPSNFNNYIYEASSS
ncbi:hypothetical protein MTR_7g029195 [Medicago truncatula]|uniref:Uncharacterized protein n=1 Tax=Medicago truncatula TaxID=3880 RepID=A0A072U852_MEDTR|nr:hypothetical protein MTR_7g029195 [Medicago truncatula]